MPKLRVNIFDAFIVVLMVGVIFVVGSVTGTGSSIISAGENRDVYFTVEITHLRENFMDNVNIGDIISDSTRGHYLGVVDSFEVKPTEITIVNRTEEEFVETTVPERYTLLLTIRSNGSETDTEIAAEGHPIRIGQRMTIKGKGYAGSGFITNIRVE